MSLLSPNLLPNLLPTRVQVCNLTTYPHLMGFFRELGVDTEESDMSFALSTPEVEWGSRGLAAIFAQPGLWRSPKFLLMVWDVVRQILVAKDGGVG